MLLSTGRSVFPSASASERPVDGLAWHQAAVVPALIKDAAPAADAGGDGPEDGADPAELATSTTTTTSKVTAIPSDP